MSLLREFTDQLTDRASAERGVWEPDASGAPYRAYAWYYMKTRNVPPSRENFCHFYRVVLLWAPLLWLKKPAERLLAIAVIMVGVIFGGKLIASHPDVTVTTLKVFVGVVAMALSFGAVLLYLLWCTVIMCHLVHEMAPEKYADEKWEWLATKPNAVKALVTLSAAPVIIVLAVLGATLGSLVAVFVFLHRDQDVYRRSFRWTFYQQFSDHRALSWIRPWMVVPLALAVMSWWYPVLQYLLVGAAAFGVFFGAVMLLTFLAERAQQKRREAAEARRDEWMRRILIRPAHTPRDRTVRFRRVRAVGQGVVDLLALMWAVIVTRKWRICPLVKLPDQDLVRD